MPKTIVGVNDPKTIKRQSIMLAAEVSQAGYFDRKFMGVGEKANTPLQLLEELQSEAGDEVSYDLSLQIGGKPIQGDNILRGKETNLKFATDTLLIDQLRQGVNTGGKMTRKRTLHKLRDIARASQKDYWATLIDETFFMYLSGARGINTNFIEDLDFTGYAGNAFSAPDDMHQMYGGTGVTAKAALAATDKMTLRAVDRLKTRAATMGGRQDNIPSLQPIKINGEDHYVLVMHEFQSFDLRQETGETGWIAMQKAAASAEGRNNPIFKGGLGMHNNVVLHAHRNVIQFDDYGAGADVEAARALFLGKQAGVAAYGSPGTNQRFDWTEETEDRGNQVVIDSGTIVGIKKCTYNIDGTDRDFGVVAMDTAAADPG